MEVFVKAKLLVPLPAASLVLGSNLGPEPYPWGGQRRVNEGGGLRIIRNSVIVRIIYIYTVN
jgi:hypothetical protein